MVQNIHVEMTLCVFVCMCKYMFHKWVIAHLPAASGAEGGLAQQFVPFRRVNANFFV